MFWLTRYFRQKLLKAMTQANRNFSHGFVCLIQTLVSAFVWLNACDEQLTGRLLSITLLAVL